MKKLYISKTFLKKAGGRKHAPHPILPRSVPGHKLQKPSKESGIFQSHGTIYFINFSLTKRQSQVERTGGWRMTQRPPLPPLIRS